MSKRTIRTYSRDSKEALTLLGRQIRAGRIEKKITLQNLADRVGVSRGLIQRIEKGDPKCEIGVVFEAASLVGLKLFGAETEELSGLAQQVADKLALLPKSVRKDTNETFDDF